MDSISSIISSFFFGSNEEEEIFTKLSPEPTTTPAPGVDFDKGGKGSCGCVIA
jgi:hypothetical protein